MHPEDFKLVQQLAGLTNRETAEKLEVSEVAVEKWRAGERTISPVTARELLAAARDVLGEKLRRFNDVNRKYG